jgi:carbon storage regulator CsrA
VLISRRREGEALRVGDGVEIRIVSVRKKKVILGIIAPRDVKITAAKLNDAEIANTLAAANSASLPEFLHAPGIEGERVVFLLDSVTQAEIEPATADKKSGKPE